MFCTNCGTRLDDDARFCTNCGTRVGAAESAATPALRHLYMDAKGLTLVNYKFEIRDEAGQVRYRAATVTESAFTYNARIYFPDDTEATAIHQQKKLTMAAMNFDITTPDGRLITEALQRFQGMRYTFELPAFGIMVDGDFLSLNFSFTKDGQQICKVQKKLMSWGDSYELAFTDPAMEQVYLSVVMVIQMVIAASRHRRRR